jgi:hypothetical protein
MHHAWNNGYVRKASLMPASFLTPNTLNKPQRADYTTSPHTRVGVEIGKPLISLGRNLAIVPRRFVECVGLGAG